MIAAMAKSADCFEEGNYFLMAKKTEEFLSTKMIDEEGDLKLCYRAGEAMQEGKLDDYAFYAFALLELYQVSYECIYLKRAITLTKMILALFFDRESGGCFLYGDHQERLISRPKETYDGAIPSGNSVTALVLAKLAKLTGEKTIKKASELQMRFLAGVSKQHPSYHAMTLIAILEVIYPTKELICVSADEEVPEELIKYRQKMVGSNMTILLKTPKNQKELEEIVPYTAAYPLPEKGVMYYLCEDGRCLAPTGHLETMVM